MTSGLSSALDSGTPSRSEADRFMRRFLLLPQDGPRQSILGAQQAFSRSIWISATRCLFTYILLPVLRPVLGISGDLGPLVGLSIGFVSMTAIFFACRRFFAADHRYRWRYAAVAGAVLLLLIVQTVNDITELMS